jgi:YD repeat-containing protein
VGGGEPVYDVTVYDAAGRPVGSIGTAGTARQSYDALRRVLIADDIRA